MSDEPILEMPLSPFRYAVGLVASLGLGGLLIFIGGRMGGTGAIAALIGLFPLAAAWLMLRKGRTSLILTETRLMASTGETVCEIAEIDTINRGLFAMRPSNGFTIRLKSSAPAIWTPGLWWRWGRSVGVGGMVNPGTAKGMAERLQAMITAAEDGSDTL